MVMNRPSLPLSLALRRKKDAVDKFHTIDDASDVSSGVFPTPSPSSSNRNNKSSALKSSTTTATISEESSSPGGSGDGIVTEDDIISEEVKAVGSKTTFKQRIAAFGRMYGGGGVASSPKASTNESPVSVTAEVGIETPQKDAGTSSSPRTAKDRLRHLMGHHSKSDGAGSSSSNRRETASTQDYETEDDSIDGNNSRRNHNLRTILEHSQPKRPSLLNPPSLADMSSMLKPEKDQKVRRSRKPPSPTSLKTSSPKSSPNSEKSPTVYVRPSLLSPPSLADVTTVIQERNVLTPIAKSTKKEDNHQQSPTAKDSATDDGAMERYLARAKTRRSRSCGSSVSHARSTVTRPMSIRGTNSTLTLTLDRPHNSPEETQSVHPDMLRSPGVSTSGRSKTPTRQLRKRTAPSTTNKSPRNAPPTLPELFSGPVTPTLDTRVSTPLDCPERSSRHTVVHDDDVDTPKHVRRASSSRPSPVDPSGRHSTNQQQSRHISSSASCSPTQRRAISTPGGGSSNSVAAPRASSIRETKDLSLSSSQLLDTPEKSSRHTVAHDTEVEARSSRRSGLDPSTPGRQRRAFSHSPIPRQPNTPKTPKTPTLESLTMTGNRLLTRANSTASSSPGSCADPSVERIMKMLHDISPKSKSASSSPSSNDEVEPAEDVITKTPSSSKSATKKRRIKISASLLLSDDEDIDPRELINAVANSPSKQIRAGRVELLKKEMLEEVKAARSRTPKSRRAVVSASSSTAKSPSSTSSRRNIRTVPLESLVDNKDGQKSGDESTSGRSIERSQSQKSVSEKSTGTPTAKQVRRVHSTRTISRTAASPRTPTRSHSDSYGPSDHERKSRSPRTSSSFNVGDSQGDESARKSPRNLARSPSNEAPRVDMEKKSRSPRIASRRTSNESHDSHERPISRSLHKSRSGRRPGSRKSVQIDDENERGAQLEAGPSSLRTSSRCTESEVDPDDEPILVQPVEGRKAMKMLSADMDMDVSRGTVFAQLQIPGVDSDQKGMAVQYEDC